MIKQLKCKQKGVFLVKLCQQQNNHDFSPDVIAVSAASQLLKVWDCDYTNFMCSSTTPTPGSPQGCASLQKAAKVSGYLPSAAPGLTEALFNFSFFVTPAVIRLLSCCVVFLVNGKARAGAAVMAGGGWGSGGDGWGVGEGRCFLKTGSKQFQYYLNCSEQPQDSVFKPQFMHTERQRVEGGEWGKEEGGKERETGKERKRERVGGEGERKGGTEREREVILIVIKHWPNRARASEAWVWMFFKSFKMASCFSCCAAPCDLISLAVKSRTDRNDSPEYHVSCNAC